MPLPTRSGAISFSIGNKGYVGLGFDNNGGAGQLKDFYEYDVPANTWTRKADLPALGREEAVGFAIGDKGYVVSGVALGTNLKEVWEYDPAADAWTRKADFPGLGRHDAVGFVVGNYGYFGTGMTNLTPLDQLQLSDWWRYDPVSDTWVQKNNFSGGTRNLSTAFSLGDKGYLAMGSNDYYLNNEWWQYNPATDVWIRKADFPGMARYAAGGFGLNNKCYVGNGGVGLGATGPILFDWYEYDIATDKWAPKKPQSLERYLGVGFVVDNKAYFGTGYSNSNGTLNDFFRFDPE